MVVVVVVEEAFLIICGGVGLCIIIRQTKQQWSLAQVVVNGTINRLRGENCIQFESLLSSSISSDQPRC
jgi:hypothetical protein